MMKKTFLILVLFLGALICLLGYARKDYFTAIGHKAPALRVDELDNAVRSDESAGRYVLLNFWSSADAPSRRDANVYTAWLRKHPEAELSLVSVNFDKSEGLFHEIVRRDSLNASEQYNVSGNDALKVSNAYGLKSDGGYGTLLLSPAGRIVAHNPTPQQLSELFGE